MASLSSVTRFLRNPPVFHPTVFRAPSSVILGSVTCAENVSIWYNAVLRADINTIELDRNVNIQDGVVVHVTRKFPVKLGEGVSVGHNATIHGCTVERDCLVGMGAVLLDDCYISKESIVAAGATVPPGKKFPPRSLIMGQPAKIVRELSDKDLQIIYQNATRYN